MPTDCLGFFVAESRERLDRSSSSARLLLTNPVYAYLQRYFVIAGLDERSPDFLAIHLDTEVSGYRLERLRAELGEALADLKGRPESFQVFVGWVGATKSKATEIWDEVERADVESCARELLKLVEEAQAKHLKLIALGD